MTANDPSSWEDDNKPFRVAVVVVTYRSARVIRECLTSIAELGPSMKFVSVTVVDNASPDSTVEIVRSEFPQVTVLQSGSNIGYAAAINVGHRASPPHDVLIILNPDTAVSPGCLPALARQVQEPGVGIAVPRIIDKAGQLSYSLRRRPSVAGSFAESLLGGPRAGRYGWGEVVFDPQAYTATRSVEWATGAVLAVSAACWRAVGDWDESFFLYSEETEFMTRVQEHGWEIRFVPDAVCVHEGGASGSSPQLWALLVTNKVRLFRRSHSRGRALAFRAAVLAGQAARGLRGDSNARAAVRALVRPLGDQGHLDEV